MLSTRFRRLLTAATALMALLASTMSATAEMVSYGTWFKIGSEVSADWLVAQTNADTIVIRPKRLLSSRPLRRVLVLYPRSSSAYDTAITKIVSVIGDKRIDAEFTVNNFNIDNTRGKAALEYAEQNNFDLVLSMGSESTAWLWSAYRGGRLPVISVCSKDPVLLGQMKDYENGSGNNFAFTSLNMPIDAQMSYVLQLKPQLKNLAILVDANNVSAVQTQAQPAQAFAKARGIRVFDLATKSQQNVKTELAQLVRDAVTAMRKNDPDLVNSIFWITGSTTVFAEIATINAHAFRVPVLSAVTDVVQAGDNSAALSVGISFESNAYQAALYAVDVLESQRKVGDLPVAIVSPPDVAISFRKAREIGMRIPMALFEGATVIYDNDGRLVRSNSADLQIRKKAASAADVAPPSVAPATPNSFE